MIPIPFKKEKEKEVEKKAEIEERPKIIITPDVFAKFIDPNPFLEQIEAYLRGEVLIRVADGFEKKKIGRPRLSEEGIQEILKIMRMRLSEIYRMPELDSNFIRWETYFFNLNIAEILAKNARAWEMDGSYYQETCDFLVSAFEVVLRMQLLRRFQSVQPRELFEV